MNARNKTIAMGLGFFVFLYLALKASSPVMLLRQAEVRAAKGIAKDLVSLSNRLAVALISHSALIPDNEPKGILKLAPGIPDRITGIRFSAPSLFFQFCDPRLYSFTTKLREPAPEDLRTCIEKNAVLSATITFKKRVEESTTHILARAEVQVPFGKEKSMGTITYGKDLEFFIPRNGS